jgi:hypothetical protein
MFLLLLKYNVWYILKSLSYFLQIWVHIIDKYSTTFRYKHLHCHEPFIFQSFTNLQMYQPTEIQYHILTIIYFLHTSLSITTTKMSKQKITTFSNNTIFFSSLWICRLRPYIISRNSTHLCVSESSKTASNQQLNSELNRKRKKTVHTPQHIASVRCCARGGPTWSAATGPPHRHVVRIRTQDRTWTGTTTSRTVMSHFLCSRTVSDIAIELQDGRCISL